MKFRRPKLQEIRKMMEEYGVPGNDLYDLPSSRKCFPDGSQYRIEIAGVEKFSSMIAMLDEAKKRKVPIHRAICTVGGSTYCNKKEIEEMAKLAHDEQIEMVMVIGHRKAWDVGSKEMSNPEGIPQGPRLRGSESMSYWIEDMMRNIEAGVRGFLVYDEGLLGILNYMRDKGFIPKETIFKWSVFGGQNSPAGAKLVKDLGVNSMNPLSDVSLPILAAIRSIIDIPLDVYLIIVDAFGGMFRAYDAPEIARIASPVYFKIEPGPSEGEIYKPWVSKTWEEDFIRLKVKLAEILIEIVQSRDPDIKLSEHGPKDLVLPVV